MLLYVHILHSAVDDVCARRFKMEMQVITVLALECGKKCKIKATYGVTYGMPDCTQGLTLQDAGQHMRASLWYFHHPYHTLQVSQHAPRNEQYLPEEYVSTRGS